MRKRLPSLVTLFIVTLLPGFVTEAQLTAPVKLIRGKLINSRTGAAVDGGRVWVFQGKLKEAVTNSRINPADGSFQVFLDASTTYRFNIVSPSYIRTDITYLTPPEVEYQEVDTSFTVPPIPLGEDLFNGRLFEPGRSVVVGADRLAKAIGMLKRHPNVAVTITTVPDVVITPKPAPKPPKASKRKKKGGAAPPAPPPVPETPPIDFAALDSARQLALKNYFKTQSISVTRLSWKSGSALQIPSTATDPLPSNVRITITGIEPLDDEDDE